MIQDRLLFISDTTWMGKLELYFSRSKNRSILRKCKHLGPLFIQKVFYPEKDKNIPHVYILHPPGGLVGGDKLKLIVQLEPGSQALLTTPGSTKFYRTNGLYAYQEHIFKLESNASLEWLPRSNIFFPKTKTKIDTIFILKKGARIISSEISCFRSIGSITFAKPEEVNIALRIHCFNSVGLRDRLQLNEWNCTERLGGFQISAILFAMPLDETILKKIRSLIKPIKNIQIGGVTLLDELLIVRLLGNDNQILEALLHNIWSIIRPIIIGKKSVIPRVWYT